jgi:hypothetical protein
MDGQLPKENQVGMNQDGDGHVPIPDDVIEKMKGADISEKVDSLRRMLDDQEADSGHADLPGLRLPVFVTGETVVVRGVKYEVVEITAESLRLRPRGFSHD